MCQYLKLATFKPYREKKVHKMPLKMASFDKKIAIAGIFLEKEKIWRESGIKTKRFCRYTLQI